MHRARMEDVARAAGVSAMTVSRALRDPSLVSAKTRRRIERAIEACNYVPDLRAASLAARSSQFVALVVPTIASSIFSDTVAGIAEQVSEHRLQVLLGETGYDLAREEALVEAFLGHQPRGIMVVGCDHTARTTRLLRSAGIPVVETWDLSSTAIGYQVGLHNDEAFTAATELMLSKGRRRLAFIGGTGDRRARLRLEGFLRALRRRRLKPVQVVETGDLTRMASGRAAMETLLGSGLDIDGVVAVNDVVAAGALFEALRGGIKVPEQMGFIGFGDFEFSSQISPRLSTVAVSRHRIGVETARLLLERPRTGRRAVDVGFAVEERETT